MGWVDFTTQDAPRLRTALEAVRSDLVARGAPAGGVTVELVRDAVNLRYRLSGARGPRELEALVELTPTGEIDGQMAIVVSLEVRANGVPVPLTYSPGAPVSYLDEPALRERLDAALAAIPSEVQPRARLALGV